MENNVLKSNQEILQEVEATCSHINKMFFLAMCGGSNELNELLNELEDFQEIFPDITLEDWGMYSDDRELPALLFMYGYDGWLVEIAVPERDRFKFKEDNTTISSYTIDHSVTRHKFVYCKNFNDIIPTMLKFSKDVLEEDIINFRKLNK